MKTSKTSLDPSEFEEIKEFLKLLAKESSEIIRPYFKKQISIETKSDNTPVTIADRCAEERIRELIEKHYPSHGIIGEEFGKKNEGAKFSWMIDPIDGTKSFICGSTDFGTMIAFMEDGNPTVGMINQPILNELMIGDGETTTLNGERVFCRKCENFRDAILLASDLLNVGNYQDSRGFNNLTKRVKLSRTWGNCYGYTLLASGYADIMIDPVMSPWDIMALIPVVRGAGGVITDYQGGDPVKGNSIVAASAGIHPLVIEILSNSSMRQG